MKALDPFWSGISAYNSTEPDCWPNTPVLSSLLFCSWMMQLEGKWVKQQQETQLINRQANRFSALLCSYVVRKMTF